MVYTNIIEFCKLTVFQFLLYNTLLQNLLTKACVLSPSQTLWVRVSARVYLELLSMPLGAWRPCGVP